MHRRLGDDIRVEAVAKVDRVDVITVRTQSVPVHSEKRRIYAPVHHWTREETGKASIPFQVAVHDREEDLKEQVHRVDQHGEKV